MTLRIQGSMSINLHVGPTWERFEDIRVGAAAKLSSIRNGTMGILKLKKAQYRIISEDDFQKLYGIATEADHLRRDVQLIIQAATIVSESDSEASRKMLQMVAFEISEKVKLSCIDGSQPLKLTDFELGEHDDDDSLVLPRR